MRRLSFMVMLVMVFGLVGLSFAPATPAYAQEPPPESGQQVSGTTLNLNPIQQGQTLEATTTLQYVTNVSISLRVYYPTDWSSAPTITSARPWSAAGACAATPPILPDINGIPVDCSDFTLAAADTDTGNESATVNFPVGTTADVADTFIAIGIVKGNDGAPGSETVPVEVIAQPFTRYAANTAVDCPAGTTVGVDCFTGTSGLQDAINASFAGQTVGIVDGYTLDGGATVDRDLEIIAEGGPPAQVNSSVSGAGNCATPMLTVDGTDIVVTIDNIEFDGSDATCSNSRRDSAIVVSDGQAQLTTVSVLDVDVAGLALNGGGALVDASTFSNSSTGTSVGIRIQDTGGVETSITTSSINGFSSGITDISDDDVTIGDDNVITNNGIGISFVGLGGNKFVQRNNINNNAGNGLSFTHTGGFVNVFGNTVTGNSLAFIQSSGQVRIFGNNFQGNTTEGASRFAGGGSVRKNYWTDTPQPGGTTDLLTGFTAGDWIFRLGAPMESVAFGFDSVTMPDIGEGNTVSFAGGTGLGIIVSTGAGTDQTNVPFGKFNPGFGDNRCSDYLDFYVFARGTGNWTATIPIYSSGGCQGAVDELYYFDFGQDEPEHAAVCTTGRRPDSCYWQTVDSIFTTNPSANEIEVTAPVEFFYRTPIVAGDSNNTDPTSISLIGFAAQPGSTQLATLLPTVVALLVLVAGSAGVLLLRRTRR